MKNPRIWITTLLLLTAASLSLQAQTAANAVEHSLACSNARVAGDWAFTETGTLIPTTGAAPFAAVASFTLDSTGNLVGSATSSWGGTVTQGLTLQGTGTVNSDCTGTLTINVYESGTLLRTASFNIVYVNNSRAARAILTSLVLANGTSIPGVITLNVQKVFDELGRP